MILQQGDSQIFACSDDTQKLYQKIGNIQSKHQGFHATKANTAFARGGSQGHMYAPLPEMMDTLNKWCQEEKLVYSVTPCGKGMLITLMDTESGQFIRSTFSIPITPDNNDSHINTIKKWMTAMNRYAISFIFNLGADPDFDGEDSNKIQEVKSQTQPTLGFPASTVKTAWLTPNTPEWTKAVERIKAGETVSKLRTEGIAISKENAAILEKYTKKDA